MDEKGKMNTEEYEELIKEVKANSPYKRLSSAKKKWMSVLRWVSSWGLKRRIGIGWYIKTFLRPKEIARKDAGQY